MLARLMAFTTAALLIILPLQTVSTAFATVEQSINSNQTILPTALDDYIFDDLPFNQKRQALREEINKRDAPPITSNSPKRYNLLIR